MTRRPNLVRERKFKHPKLQLSIRSVFLRSEPKFIEGPGLLPVCRFCQRKFLTPQGFVAHLHIDERAGCDFENLYLE